jgi:putative ATP-grasp target RiPP
LSRLALYPNIVSVEHSRTELDSSSQTTNYFDKTGRPMTMGGHGTSQATASQTQTGGDGGGAQPPAPADTDMLEDSQQD